jgi:hypothetical protein
MTRIQKIACEIQFHIDSLGLVGRDLFDVLECLEDFADRYRVEWAVRAPQVVASYDAERIRVWYNDETKIVTAVVHG